MKLTSLKSGFIFKSKHAFQYGNLWVVFIIFYLTLEPFRHVGTVF